MPLLTADASPAMSFPPSFLDELRARLPVSEVVRRRVKLQKAGREWKGLSPFNKERTPSFTVNDQKGFYHDFSSGKHGDIFNFIMESEGLTFPEAVEQLAHLAGISIPATSKELNEFEERRKTLHDVLELATKFFELSLASKLGAKARGYLADRGIQPSTQREFRIGYAPQNRFALKEHLGAQGVSVADMISVGLLIAGDDIPVPYDRFRDRVIIPIHDQRGRVIAFGGRSLSEEVQPKYLNSPETNLFHKSDVVFNFHRAREAARKDQYLVAVEGYLDAISVYQAGLKSVVALMGTAFTEEQVQNLWRLAPEPIICLDGDKAGLAAAERSIDRILPQLRTGVSFHYAFLPQKLDPDELIRSQGIDRFHAVLNDAVPLWDMLWDREFKKGDIKTPDQKAVFEKSIMGLVGLIGDPLVRDSYRARARAHLVALFKTLDWESATKKKSFVSHELRLGRQKAPLEGIEKVLLGTLIEYPDLLEIHLDRLMNIEFTGDLEGFKRDIYRICEEFGTRPVITFYMQISDEFVAILEDVYGPIAGSRARQEFDPAQHKIIGVNLHRRFPLIKFEPPQNFVAQCVELFFRMLEARQLERELAEVRADPVRIESDEELQRYLGLVKELMDMRGTIAARDQELANEARELRRSLVPQERVLPTAEFFQPLMAVNG